MTDPLQGLALYVRHITKKRHGTPKQLAKKFADHGMKWVAIGGPWHEKRDGRIRTKFMNTPEVCRRYADAFYDRDVLPFIWGYPWQGTEEKFADQMTSCVGEYNLGLLDPELGSNPTRSSKGRGKVKADDHAVTLVKYMAERFDRGTVGLSTFGSGVRMKWFPLYAFVESLGYHFPGRTFMGGQTYTQDKHIDPSIADFLKVAKQLYGDNWSDTIQIVPNYGTYKFIKRDLSKPLKGSNRKAVRKTKSELYHHLGEFIDEGEPVGAMIGWAENFVNPVLWRELARFASQLERGDCILP